MIVHFMASKGTVEEQASHYRRITHAVTSHGHTLANDWVDKIHAVITNPEKNPIDWGAFDKEQEEALSKSDVVIAEITEGGFFVGYRLSQAIQQRKPILLLFRDKAFSQKSSFAGARELTSDAQHIQAEEYNDSNVDDIVAKFLEENIITAKDRRFNFYLDPVLYNYLRKESFRTGKTKADIVREVMSREMESRK